MRVPLAIGVALVLAGCGPQMEWVHPTKRGEAAQQDWRECRFEAVRASAAVGHPNPFMQATERQQSEGRVMEACMAARGYRLEPVRVTAVTAQTQEGGPPKASEPPR
jgi:hypothetical protein